MTMGTPVSDQLMAFGQSILLGLSAGVLYDLLRPFRLRRPRLTGWLDGAYWLTVAAASFLLLLRRAYGELRGFLVLLAAVGWQLYGLQGKVAAAQEEKERYAAQVEQTKRENDALSADIAEGPTREKIEEIARDELGLVTPNEYVFDDISN